MSESAALAITEWLAKIGLDRYAAAFADNDIDVSVLRHLTDDDLEKIGVSLGHQRKILAAIAEFGDTTPATPSLTEPKRPESAERRQVTVMFSDLVGSRHFQLAWTRRICARSFPPIRSASARLSRASAGS